VTATPPDTPRESSQDILATLRRERERGASPAELWRAFPRHRWPALFPLLTLAADLPRLSGNDSITNLAPDLWPEFTQVTADLLHLEHLLDHPVVPEDAEAEHVFGRGDLEAAAGRLETDHCITFEGWLEEEERRRLDHAIEQLAQTRAGSWGALPEEEAPEVHALFKDALARPVFHRLTGFEPSRDEYTLTLSLQDLDDKGIGWHRDLYWPREWVGQDVFAVLYGLGNDSPEKGGAFLHYVPWNNTLRAVYRQRHQATILWNHHTTEGRLLHAVEGYRGEDTSRHLLILQCLRRSGQSVTNRAS
jgi:hypothetical protein